MSVIFGSNLGLSVVARLTLAHKNDPRKRMEPKDLRGSTTTPLVYFTGGRTSKGVGRNPA
nr:MAG TPA: hypothetical protein [Caudoviricetes sp.]